MEYFPIRTNAGPLRKFLRESTSSELSVARKMASLSAFAYFMSSVTVRHPSLLQTLQGDPSPEDSRGSRFSALEHGLRGFLVSVTMERL